MAKWEIKTGEGDSIYHIVDTDSGELVAKIYANHLQTALDRANLIVKAPELEKKINARESIYTIV